ncbi:hypothetical protein [Chrysiogenes arsenatis]|uniref:phage adaptor protein n=1 Tax=Chrysiogenes arsenatis TaxID=309797 RepID=UPI0004146E54|nr:hypothetical protein [Chrysiogenes arsenatis]
MTLEEMIDDIADIVNDPGYSSEDDILPFVNRAIIKIASRVLLPDLATSEVISTVAETVVTTDEDTGEVTESLAYNHRVLLPENFMRYLYRVEPEESSRQAIRFYKSPQDFLSDCRGDIGRLVTSVSAATMLAKYLLYVGTPKEPQLIRLHFYRKPDALVDLGDTPDYLPEFAHESIIHAACHRIYERIEDGIEGQKTNTLYYEQKFEQGIAELEKFAKLHAPRPPATVVRGEFL